MVRIRWAVFMWFVLGAFSQPFVAQSAQNDLFHELVRMGRGAVQHVEWHPDGKIILVDTERGAWLYSPNGTWLVDAAHIEDARLARFSLDGRFIVGVDGQNAITFWDSTTHARLRSLPGGDTYVRALEWKPDGTQLASLDRTGGIIVWDATRGQKSLELRLDGADQIAWSRAGRYLAAIDSESGKVQVWDAAGQLIFAQTPEYPTPYGSDLIWRNDTQLLRRVYDEVPSGDLWDIPSGKTLDHSNVGYASDYSPDGSQLAVRGSQVAVVTWSPDGRYIASGDWTSEIIGNTNVFVEDATTGKTLHVFPYEHSITKLAWSPDSLGLIVVDSASQIFVIGLSSSSPTGQTIAHTDIGTVAVWRGDGRVIAAADTNYGARLWNAKTGASLVSRMLSGQPATKLAWQPGGTLLATAGGVWWQSENNNVYVWDSSITSDSAVDPVFIIPHTTIVAGIAWSPDGKTLASAERSEYIRLWKPSDPNLIHVISLSSIRITPFIDYTQTLDSIEWSPKGDVLDYAYSSSGNGGSVQLIDVAAGAIINGGAPHYDSTWIWTPDNRFIWANWGHYGDGGAPTPVYVYDISVGGQGITDDVQSPWVLSGLKGEVAKGIFSPDARLLIGFDTLNHGMIWDVKTQKPLVHLRDVYDAVWSPDSTMLAIYETDGVIRIINPGTGEVLYTFSQHYRAPRQSLDYPQVIWSPDSREVAVLDRGVLFIYERSSG